MAEQHYLTRDEYIDSQNHQNGLIRKEFERLDEKVEKLDQRLAKVDEFIVEQKEHNLAVQKQFKKIDERFEKIDQRFDNIDTKFVSVDVRMEQMQAQIRNGRKKNPFLPVEPVPINDLERGCAKYPDPTMFPRNAREFYALRNPTTEKHENMLYYLVSFYDIHPQPTSSRLSASSKSASPSMAKPENTEKSDNEEDLDEEEDSVERTVDKLEDILGLDEERFIAFRRRAHEQWWNEAPVRTKRRHEAVASSGRRGAGDGEPLPVRRRVSSSGNSSSSSSSGGSDGNDGNKGSDNRGGNNNDDGNRGERAGFGSFGLSGAGRLAGRISISELMCSVRSRATSSEERSNPHISWREGSTSFTDLRKYGPGGRPSSRKSASEKAASAGPASSRKTGSEDGAGPTQVMSTPDSERIRGAGPHREGP